MVFATSPAKLHGLWGHEPVVSMLARAQSRQSLHHALLISGPKGVGKKTLARALLAAALCRQAPGQGCHACATCTRIQHGTLSDLVEVGPSGASARISRAHVQQAVLDLQRAPHEGPLHLRIFAPADRMGPEAANALLKTLEEPRPGVHIALITTRPTALLPTLRSRCLHLALSPLSRAHTLEVLEHHNCPPDSVRALIDLYPGQPGEILRHRDDPSVTAAEHCITTMQERLAGSSAPSEIFGSPKSAIWEAWDALVTQTPEPSLPAPEPDNAIERVTRSGKKKRSSSSKRASKKGSASKKPSAARQRQAILRLCELWLARLRVSLTQTPSPAHSAQVWGQCQALMRLAQDCERNVSPRLLLERALLSISQAMRDAT